MKIKNGKFLCVNVKIIYLCERKTKKTPLSPLFKSNGLEIEFSTEQTSETKEYLHLRSFLSYIYR